MICRNIIKLRSIFLYLIIIFLLLDISYLNSQPIYPQGFKPNRVINKNPKNTPWPYRTIREIQWCHPDSLAIADALQWTAPSRWTLQKSRYITPDGTGRYSTDTMTIVGVVVIEPMWLNYTAGGYTCVLADTGYYSDPEYNTGSWRYIVVRVPFGVPGISQDTTRYHDMLNIQRGDVVTVHGWVWEFPSYAESGAPAMHSMTQFVPLTNPNFEIIDSNYPLPQTKKFPAYDPNPFYQGIFPGGNVLFSTGEQWESHYVELYNWTVRAIISAQRGTFDMVNDAGDVVSSYDASRWYTTVEGRRDPNSTYETPPVGAVIDTIRGWMSCVTGGEAQRGYRISPVFPGDIVFGISAPRIQNHSRNPIVVGPNDSVRVEATVIRLPGGYPIDTVLLFVSYNNAPFGKPIVMKKDIITNEDTVRASATIGKRTAGTFVRYFIKATDDMKKKSSILANAHPMMYLDTSKGFFNYTVLNRELTIQDVQYTPYLNGTSPYVGAAVSLTGVITADTSDYNLTPIGTGTTCWYMQRGNAPWSGIWVVGAESTLAVLQRGDSVRITGTIAEYFSNTRLQNIQHPVEIIARNRPLPEPVSLPSGQFASGISDGNPLAEPYEHMLIRFDSVNVTDVQPTFANIYEYLVNDGTGGGVLVRRDGKNNFTIPPDLIREGKEILSVGDRIVPLIGTIHFANNRYKIAPRKDSDINAGSVYTYNSGWNMVSVPFIPLNPLKTNIFPGAVSNAFAYYGTYVSKDTLSMGSGYWLKFTSNYARRMHGERRNSIEVPVTSGWNMIGSVTKITPINEIQSIPPGIITSPYYGYEAGYSITPLLVPGKGYWVKVNQPGVLTIGSTFVTKSESSILAELNNYNSITIIDKDGNKQTLYFGLDAEGVVNKDFYEMPPLAPSATLDVRFASQRILETYPKNIETMNEYPISIQSTSFPIKVSWNITSASGKNFSITDFENGKIIGIKELKGDGSFSISNSKLTGLMLKIQNGEELPINFDLSQNYPNPFNPTTKMRIAVPKTALVEIVVYNILGQKVCTLINDVIPAGYHSIEWNGINDHGMVVPSGIYFIRMVSESFSSVKKVMMLK